MYLDGCDTNYDKALVKDVIGTFCNGGCTIYFAANVEYCCFLSRIGESVDANLKTAAKFLDDVINRKEPYMAAHMGEALAHAYYTASAASNDKTLIEKAIVVQSWACTERTVNTELYYHSMCNLIGYQCLCYASCTMRIKAEGLKREIIDKFGKDHALSKQVNDMCVFIGTQTTK